MLVLSARWIWSKRWNADAVFPLDRLRIPRARRAVRFRRHPALDMPAVDGRIFWLLAQLDNFAQEGSRRGIARLEFSADPRQAIPAPHRAVIRFAEAVAAARSIETLRDIFRCLMRLAQNDDSRRKRKPCRGTTYRAPTFAAIRDHCCLVATGPGQGIHKRAGARRVIPHLKRGVKVEDVAGREAAAGAVNGEDRVAVYFVEVNVLEDGAAPVREVEKIHAGLVGVYAGLDRDTAHGFAAAKEQVEIVAVAAAAFLDDLRNGDAEIFPGVLLLDSHVSDELAQMIDAQCFADLVDGEAHVGRGERGVAGVDAGRGQLHGIRRAVEVEPRSGGRVVLVILDAEERARLRATEA